MNIFTIQDRITARCLAVLTVFSMLLSAFPAPFLVAEAATSSTISVAVLANPSSGNPEYFEISYTGTADLDLDGWQVTDASTFTYSFSGITLEDGERVRVCQNEGDTSACDDTWNGSPVWNNDGDTFTLIDESGDVIVVLETSEAVEGQTQEGGSGSLEVLGTTGGDKIAICHATDSDSNPYVFNEPSVNSFFSSGHDQDNEDIIPPFFYDNGDGLEYFPGTNWEGDFIDTYNNDCRFADTDYATINLLKVVEGEDTPDLTQFDLTVDGAVYQSGDSVPVIIDSNGNSGTTFTVSETNVPQGYTLTSVECSLDGGGKTATGTTEAMPKIKVDEAYTCTITNLYEDTPTYGCMDPAALNYDPQATEQGDVVCSYVYQCTDGLLFLDTESGDPSTMSLYTVDEADGSASLWADYGLNLHSVMAVAADGTIFSIVEGSGDLVTLDDSAGNSTIVGPTGLDAEKPVAMEIAPDGTLYVFTQDTDKLYEVDTTTGAATELAALTLNVDGGDVIFDGGFIYYVKNTGEVYQIDPDTYAEMLVGTLTVGGERITSAATKDGTHYAYTREDSFHPFTLNPFVEGTATTQTGPFAWGDGSFCAAPEVLQCVDEPNGSWADDVVANNQGLRKNSSAITDPNRIDPAAALNAADWVSGGGTGFYSLGFGGTIVLEFDSYVPDISGADLVVHEATNGTAYPAETAAVAVSQNGIDWETIGVASNLVNTTTRETALDFTSTGFAWIKFVKLTDTTDPLPHAADADGFDLDAVFATQQVCEAPTTPEEPEEATIKVFKHIVGEDGPADPSDFGFEVDGSTPILFTDGWYATTSVPVGETYTITEADMPEDYAHVKTVCQVIEVPEVSPFNFAEDWQDYFVDWTESQPLNTLTLEDEGDLGICVIINEYDEPPAPLACEPGVNLLANADFEAPVVTDGAGWDIFDLASYPALVWAVDFVGSFTGAPNDASLELHAGVNGWQPSTGDQYAELDADWQGPSGTAGEEASVQISQLVPTIDGATYRLAWDFSARPGTFSPDNDLSVMVDGVEVAGNAAQNTNNQTDWASESVEFTGNGSDVEIAFADMGEPNSEGTFLDNVSLTCESPRPQCSLEMVSDSGTVVVENNTFAVPTYEHGNWSASIPGATWVWPTEYVENPDQSVTYTFRETFTVEGGDNAVLEVAADNSFKAYLNGALVIDRSSETTNFTSFSQQIADVTGALIEGENTLEIEVTNLGVNGANALQNPAGVLYKLTLDGQARCEVTTDTEDDNGGGGGPGTGGSDLYRVSGYVWHDEVEDNEYDVELEDALGGWTVMITNGVASSSTTTNASGFYAFEVPAGAWTIWLETEEGWTLVYPGDDNYSIVVPANNNNTSFFEAVRSFFIPTALAAVIDAQSNLNFGLVQTLPTPPPTPTVGGSSSGGGGSSGPRCTLFDITRSGDELTLVWETRRGSDLSITANGTEIFATGDNDVVEVGTHATTLSGDTTFELTVSRGTRSDTCELSVTENGGQGGDLPEGIVLGEQVSRVPYGAANAGAGGAATAPLAHLMVVLALLGTMRFTTRNATK